MIPLTDERLGAFSPFQVQFIVRELCSSAIALAGDSIRILRPIVTKASPVSDSQGCPGLFFLGTDTDVGKTYQAVRLARLLRSQELDVGVYKPVASGVPGLALPGGPSGSSGTGQEFVDREAQSQQASASDPELLRQAAGLESSCLVRICPQMFTAPLAPPSAAALEGRMVDDPLMLEGARWWLSRCEFLIVEGAGGVMSPISQNSTCLDLAVKLKLPVVLVAANRLGCVSHVLVCAEAIRHRGLTLLAVLLNELPTAKSVSMADEKLSALTSQSSLELIASFLPGTPLVQDAESLILVEQFPR